MGQVISCINKWEEYSCCFGEGGIFPGIGPLPAFWPFTTIWELSWHKGEWFWVLPWKYNELKANDQAILEDWFQPVPFDLNRIPTNSCAPSISRGCVLPFPSCHSPSEIFSYILFFFSISNLFSLKDNCFAEFIWFLPNINMNQPQVYLDAFPLKPPSHLHPHPTLLCCYRVLLWVPWVIQQIMVFSVCSNHSFDRFYIGYFCAQLYDTGCGVWHTASQCWRELWYKVESDNY